MDLSVIVPVYQQEKTLECCLSSIAAQTVDMEIILVDDGSTDGSAALCDAWAAKDKRIRVIHKANGGLSDARNAGIDMASGDYITFVDSDDYIGLDTYQALVGVLRNHPEYDILEYPVNRFEGNRKKESLLSFQDKAYTNMHDYWYGEKAYRHTYAWNKVYRSPLFNSIRFPKGKVFEDAYTLPLLLEAAGTVATTSQGLYHYTSNAQGITGTAGANEWRQLLDAHVSIIGNPAFQPVDEHYWLDILNIQIYTHELTGDALRIGNVRFRHIRTVKTVLNNLLGTKNLCRLNRVFRRFVWKRS